MGAAAYWVGRANADVPTLNLLTYSGYLSDGNGNPENGDRNISVEIHDDEMGSSGLAGCDYGPLLTPVDAGHFSVSLPDACAASIEASDGDLWIEISVNGNPLVPRAPIGMVPYAIEAKTSQLAKRVEGGGATVWCGSTAGGTGDRGGWAGVKTECVTACGSSPTAHICTAEEMARSYAAGAALPASGTEGWIIGSYAATPGGTPLRQCLGWTNDTSSEQAIMWHATLTNGYVDTSL